ncbi:MAG: hypothetical protein OEY97_11115 [Nitrospirota bacterium]|nr:hypothetical protein [Nitrospirota bacterium]
MLVQTNDTAQEVLEDVQSSQGAGASLLYDTAGVHVGVRYDVQAVQYARHDFLNRTDRQLGILLDARRLMQRYTPTGRLTFTATARFTPALSPLDTAQAQPFDTPAEQELGTGMSGDPADELTPNLVAGLLANQYLLNNVATRAPGRVYVYGLDFGNEAGISGWYEMGWLVSDARYESDLLADRAQFDGHFRYVHRLLKGETGLELTHTGFFRGESTDQRIWTLGTFLANTRYRFSWRVGGGSAWRVEDDRGRFSGNGSLRVGYRWRRTELKASYRSDMGFQTFGQIRPERVQNMYFTLANKPNRRWERAVSLNRKEAGGDNSHRILASQEYMHRNGMRAGLYYTRDGLRWTKDSGELSKRSADIVTFKMTWEM